MVSTSSRGLTTPNLVEGETNRALIGAARRVWVLADSSKLGIVGLSTFGRLDEVDLFVADTGISPRAREALEDAVNELIMVREHAAEPVAQ